MSAPQYSMRIGEVLREGRRRAGLEIVDVEEATKIRIKYLRALEAEEWDALPSRAYAKGFLRTYGQMLGLDGDALVDEFRRQVEAGPEDQPFGPGQVAGRDRRRATRKPPAPAKPPPMFPPIVPIVVGLVIAIAIALAVIGLVSGPEDEEPQRAADRGGETSRQERRQERREEGNGGARDAGATETSVEVTAVSDVAICLLDETPDPLLDGVQAAGSEKGPFEAGRFELRFPDGFDPAQIELSVDGDAAELADASGPAAFRIEDGGVEAIDPPPPSCP